MGPARSFDFGQYVPSAATQTGTPFIGTFHVHNIEIKSCSFELYLSDAPAHRHPQESAVNGRWTTVGSFRQMHFEIQDLSCRLPPNDPYSRQIRFS
jgi:hypothetical protein